MKQDQKYSIMSPGFVTRSVLTLSHLKRLLPRLLKAPSASPNPGFSPQHSGRLELGHNYLCAIGTHLSQRLCMGEGNISFHKSERRKTPYHWEAESFCLIGQVQCQDCPGTVFGRHWSRGPPEPHGGPRWKEPRMLTPSVILSKGLPCTSTILRCQDRPILHPGPRSMASQGSVYLWDK